MRDIDDDEDFLYQLKRGHKKTRMIPMAEFPLHSPLYHTISRGERGVTWDQWLRAHGWEPRRS